MTTTNHPTELIDIATLATRLNVRVRYIRRLINERRIPYIKLGHFIRFDPTEIDHWLDEARAPTVSSRHLQNIDVCSSGPRQR